MFSATVNVRVKRVGLKDHRDVAILGQHMGHVPVAHADFARGHRLQPGDHSQRGRFPASRRPQKDEELPLLYVEVQPFDDLECAVGFADVVQ